MPGQAGQDPPKRGLHPAGVSNLYGIWMYFVFLPCI
jgi:hypothetical protein